MTKSDNSISPNYSYEIEDGDISKKKKKSSSRQIAAFFRSFLQLISACFHHPACACVLLLWMCTSVCVILYVWSRDEVGFMALGPWMPHEYFKAFKRLNWEKKSILNETTQLDNQTQVLRLKEMSFQDVEVKGLDATIISTQILNELMPGMDAAHLHGVVGLDENGNALWAPKSLDAPQTDEQKTLAHTGYCFNSVVSASLSLDRDIPDYQSAYCAEQRYIYGGLGPYAHIHTHTNPFTSKRNENSVTPTNFENAFKASAIVIFYNENLSVLLRSVHSVLNRTPHHLLEEIILVDDFSNTTTHPWLGETLQDYVAMGLPKTKILRLKQRRGLMGARAAGAAIASGQVFVFLDSHIEVHPFWAQPLLQHVQTFPRSIALPRITAIDPDDFQLHPSGIDALGFTWSLGHASFPEQNETEGVPSVSPIMPGGIFAIRNSWWKTLGGYDEGMRLYGGEEFELSFKTWMCGGSLNVVTCSKVGHVFRTDNYWQGQVYTVAGDEIIRNKLRTAAVWMDEYEAIVKRVVSPLSEGYTLGDISEQQKLRKELNCKSFDWFLKNVYPQLAVPDLTNGLFGGIYNPSINSCIDTLQTKNKRLGAYPCHFKHGTQGFYYDLNSKLIYLMIMDFKSCVVGDTHTREVLARRCSDALPPEQFNMWVYDKNHQTLKLDLSSRADTLDETQWCIAMVKEETDLSPHQLYLQVCVESNASQVINFKD